MSAPEPEEIYRRTRAEGRRRLRRPVLELAATALVGGFDVAFGLVAFGVVYAALAHHFGSAVAHLGGALAFGIGFVFVVVGRSELFTENFLVPIAGLERHYRSWLKLGELWVVALVFNLAGGAILAVILSSSGVIGPGFGAALSKLALHVADRSAPASFLSAIVAGALMTLLTWFVEGAADSLGVRIVMAWVVGALISLGPFDHAIVSTLELVFGLRYGVDIGAGTFAANLGLAVAGNLTGGLGFVTVARSAQAFGSRQSSD